MYNYGKHSKTDGEIPTSEGSVCNAGIRNWRRRRAKQILV